MSVNHNLYSVFEQHFPADRSRPFIIAVDGKAVSYAAMEASSAQLANSLVALGLQPGQRVAVQLQKSAAALMLYLACVRAGLVYLPLNTGYTATELAYFFEDASPSLIVGDLPLVRDTSTQSLLQQLAGQYQSRYESLAIDGNGSLQQRAAAEPDCFSTVLSRADDLAAILYTSGTTGRPKGAMLSHHNLTSNALTLKDCWGWTSRDVLLHALPIFHVHGLFVACHCVLAAGAAMIMLPKFDVGKVIEQLPQATVLMGVPTFYTRLVDSPAFSAELCKDMRLFISGSAPLLAQTHAQFEQCSGHRILERYGMSETGMLISNPLIGERRAGTVGLPLPGVEVRVVDDINTPMPVGRWVQFR
ncbi:AMP-binding protein [Oceanicoccus sp. KOV_DT_Chl]|uniref:AMP-binding protein n=1 Tax=Oceanicoccus sp. KOV_DT_Chl TaxID=1904639 RepID=UPI001F315CEF|nr:AMP-binding protein [Oceanicoccus sp. KOV_DT_Chl]